MKMGSTRNMSVTPAIALETQEAVEEDHEDHRRREQHERERGAEPPVEKLHDLNLDEVGDHHLLRPAEERGRNIKADGDEEHEECARGDAGQSQG